MAICSFSCRSLPTPNTKKWEKFHYAVMPLFWRTLQLLFLCRSGALPVRHYAVKQIYLSGLFRASLKSRQYTYLRYLRPVNTHELRKRIRTASNDSNRFSIKILFSLNLMNKFRIDSDQWDGRHDYASN
jgi:hypothetical protein